MKIGFNVKKIRDMISAFVDAHFETIVLPSMQYLENRVKKLENSSSEWVEITSANGQEAEITQEFSEIRLLAKTANANYSVTYSYDSTIFHNKPSNVPTYMICGNPTENNYGCKFKYMLTGTNNDKQYVCVDKCFSGGSYEPIEFRAWIKPVPSGPQ